MNLKKFFIFIVLSAVVLMAFGFQNTLEHKVLFEKAKFTMETKGDLKEAIKLFNELIKKYPKERAYAAKSQLYIGLCYEKLGLKEAEKSYQKVVDNYPEQTEAVRIAKEKLNLILKAQAVIERGDKEFKIRQVWAGPGVSTSGAPSPDGRYLSHAKTDDLAIREIATGKEQRLTNRVAPQFASTSRWSPDGKKIVYKWFNKDNFYDLRIIGLDGSGPRVIFQNKEVAVSPSDWSPDGKQILAIFAPKKEGTSQIVLISVADGSVRVLKTFEERIPGRVLFSPSGEYIAYHFSPKKEIRERNIFLLSADGNREIPLVEHPADDRLLGWSPNGKSVLFRSDRTGTTDIWLIRVTDGVPQGTPELIRKDIGQFYPKGFTSKGSFYYSIDTTIVDVYIATLDMKEGKFLDQPTRIVQRFEGFNIEPDWSPDGNYLAYVSYRSVGGVDSCLLCLQSVKTGEINTVPTPQLDYFKYISWAPDGRSIIVVGVDKENVQGVYKIDVQTGDVTSIVRFERGSIIKQPAWSLDGKSIFYPYWQFTENLACILVRDLETGQEEELYRQTAPPDIGRVTLSPDGQKLAFLTATGDTVKKILQHHVLRVIPAAGGKPYDLIKVPVSEGMIASYAWTPTGREILLSKRVSSGMQEQKCDELWMIPTEGGEPRKLGLAMDKILNLSIHPDGQRIAFISHKGGAEIWVMENFLPKLKSKK
ncbi:MAG: PD40 domain-containing protein [Candidatus Aminicenantes bacterium]|nr:PD40 domain-containing protein [Candidatus Aminicenantes bacterium]